MLEEMCTWSHFLVALMTDSFRVYICYATLRLLRTKELYEENAHYIRCNNSTYNVLTKANVAAIEEPFAGLYAEGYKYFMLYDKCKNSI